MYSIKYKVTAKNSSQNNRVRIVRINRGPTRTLALKIPFSSSVTTDTYARTHDPHTHTHTHTVALTHSLTHTHTQVRTHARTCHTSHLSVKILKSKLENKNKLL